MPISSNITPLRLALPKGRMQEGIFRLLEDAGIHLQQGSRGYRPTVSIADFEVKILKPQNIVEMLHLGSRDLGFAGADWVAELDGELIELLDTGLDPVSLVAAVPAGIADDFLINNAQPIVIATEYLRLTERWVTQTGLAATCVRSFGATEVFPPEDSDCIVDITATGSTLQANGLRVIATLMQSSTRMYCSPAAWQVPEKREGIESFTMLLRSVLDARGRVMLELNVTSDALNQVVQLLPAMREATISALHGSQGYAVKAAINRSLLPSLIPQLKRAGGSDIIITNPSQIVP
jgi:ATP phosphoribosyltransferase